MLRTARSINFVLPRPAVACDRSAKNIDELPIKPVQARLEQSKTEKLSRVRPGQSNKPPDLKQSEPLQARLEQTRTGKLRSGLGPPDFKQSEPLGKHNDKDNDTGWSWHQSVNLNKIHQARTALSTNYVMPPEYAEYAYEKFSSQVLSLQKSIKKNMSRAEEGYAQWQCKSQQLLQNDLVERLVN
eukprot:jgi/Psemu1/178/gm1.178_g